MTHRADQIIDAIVSHIQTAAVVPNVFAHRSLSLAEDQGELPAITVNYGEDAVLDEFGGGGVDEIDSMLTVNIVTYLKGLSEIDVRRALMAAREAVHVALLTDPTLALDFVVVTRYGGAEAPTLDSTSEFIVGSIVTPFNVHYRMNADNPA